jgi:hypothetical protein
MVGWLQDDEEGASMPCLGIFDDCDDVLLKLAAIRKAHGENESITGKVPYSAQNRVLNAYNVAIAGVEYKHLRILFSGQADTEYNFDPKLYESYDETIQLALGGTSRQRGFAFRDGQNVLLKVLIIEDSEDDFETKKMQIKNYLFGSEEWPEDKIVIRVKRSRNNDFRSIATLNIDGKTTGYILELQKGTDAECQTVCTSERKEDGLCRRILKGEYKFEVTTYSSKEWAIGTSLRLHDIPGRSGVLIHRGVNANIWSEGCLLVMRNDPTTDSETTQAANRANLIDDSHNFSTEIANYVNQREIEIKSKFKLDKVEKIIIISEENEIRD